MKDFFGNELNVGDRVAFMELNYRNFLLGSIIRFTPQKVVLEYLKNGYVETVYQYPGQLIKRT